MSKLKFKKVEWWAKNDAINSIRFTLSDGSVSEQIGTHYAVNESFEFSADRPIKNIRVRAQAGNCVCELEFLDSQG